MAPTLEGLILNFTLIRSNNFHFTWCNWCWSIVRHPAEDSWSYRKPIWLWRKWCLVALWNKNITVAMHDSSICYLWRKGGGDGRGIWGIIGWRDGAGREEGRETWMEPYKGANSFQLVFSVFETKKNLFVFKTHIMDEELRLFRWHRASHNSRP